MSADAYEEAQRLNDELEQTKDEPVILFEYEDDA